jgi:pyrroloquinoline quinone (PQQ) biosynthesis protein C
MKQQLKEIKEYYNREEKQYKNSIMKTLSPVNQAKIDSLYKLLEAMLEYYNVCNPEFPLTMKEALNHLSSTIKK